MLSHITVHNFGLIDRLTVELCPGLNIFTGETGAGKSIIIDAVRYVLGGRMTSSLVRDPSKPCLAEAVFDLSKNKSLLSDPVFEEYLGGNETLLIIRRTFFPDGRNKVTVNGLTSTVSQIKNLGNRLLDLHGPHDHQMLFSEDAHIDIIDRMSDINSDKTVYISLYEEYESIRREIKNLNDISSSRERELDMLSHQIKELERVPLDADSYNGTIEESTRAANSSKLYECAAEMLNMIGDGTSGMNVSFESCAAKMRMLVNLDPSVSPISEILERAQEEINSLEISLGEYLETLSFSPEKTDDINRRYDIYYELIRKYGPTIEDVREFYLSAKKKYDLLVDIDHNTLELSSRLSSSEKKIRESAKKLTSIRKRTAEHLKTTIEKELKELGMPLVRFECRVQKQDISRTGSDNIAFYISTNEGEAMKPLAEIISSGEAARVMLALKKALTKVDPVPCLVFDEIDSHIGGRLGAVTGKKLKDISKERQIILITHLPQIASYGDRHIKVYKSVSSGRTSIEVSPLEGKTREKELAKMMSGEKETPIALDHARDMIKSASRK